jgi:hypothetical protein
MGQRGAGGFFMFGVYQLVNSLSSLCCSVFWLLVVAVVILLFIRLFTVNKYAEDSVVERWSALLPGQADKAETYLARASEALKARQLTFPTHRERIAVSLTSSESYDFLVCQMNADFSAYISFVPVGSDLEVNWLVQDHMIRGIYRLPILGPLLLSLTKRYTFANGNKVRAFATATYSAAVEAAEQIMDEARIDRSRLNRQTSGKLGPL